MTRAEADALIGMIRGAWPTLYLDDFGMAAWQKFLEGQSTESATEAYLRLSMRQRELPTIADLRSMIRKIEVDRKMEAPALEEPEFVREIDSWIKGWIVARVQHGDKRVWPQQKEGYDYLQKENSGYRDYVWPEQVVMPPDKQREYEALGAQLTSQQIAAMIGQLTGA